MISVLTIFLFLLYLWGLGFTATYFIKKPEHFLERHFLNLGVGLGIFPLLSILLNFLHVPLDWKIFLLISMVFPLFILFKKIKAKEWKSFFSWKGKITKSDLIFLGVLLIFLLSLGIYLKGSFSYPYLEDEDPWGHAVGAKYVALEKVAYDPVFEKNPTVDRVLSYIDPYPPAYDIFMGVLHQTSPDLNWTMKFFNALLISLGFIFFYLLAKDLLKSPNKALLATFILAVLPAYLSHFIWAHALAITLFFPLMFSFLKIGEDKKWAFIATIIMGSLWVSQNVEQPLKLTTMLLIFLIVASVTHRRWLKYEFGAFFGGFFLSFLWWGVMIQKYTLKGFIRYFTGSNVFSPAEEAASSNIISTAGSGSGLGSKFISLLKSLTSAGGSASRPYTFKDFFFAQNQNMINAPIGIGIVLSLLALIGVIYLLWRYKSSLVEVEQAGILVTLFWLVFTFWAVNGQTFPLSVARGPFRSWALLSIAVALVATEGIYFLKALFAKSKLLKIGVVLLLLVGIVFTSGLQKYNVNTVTWPTSGSFVQPAEPFEYAAWFQTLPLDTKVFLYAPRDKIVIGLNGFTCLWCESVLDFREGILDQDASALHRFLKSQGYEYLIISGAMDLSYFKKTLGEEKAKELLSRRYKEMGSRSDLFVPVYYKENLFTVFRVR